jgi:hypothetical protein
MGFKIITETMEIMGKEVSLSRVFIPSKIGDNQLLMQNDPTYVLRLYQAGSKALVKAWLEGNWDLVDGAFFDNWDTDRIILPLDWLNAIPKHAMRFRSFDWGSAKPFSVGWWAMSDGQWGLPHGAMLRYREWYGASGPNKGLKLTADLVAQGILNRERGEQISYGITDPSIFIRNGGPSIMELMLKEGCAWRRGDNRREPGWQKMRQMLGNIPLDYRYPENGTTEPLIYVLETCEDSIRTIPTLQHDDVKQEDLDTEAEDHVADDWRYGVMSRPAVKDAPRPNPGLVLPKLPSQTTINELLEIIQKRRHATDRD